MKMENYIGHTSEEGRQQLLIDHLKGTSLLAERFASVFDAPNGEGWLGYIMTSGNIVRLSSDGSWKMGRGSIILQPVPC